MLETLVIQNYTVFDDVRFIDISVTISSVQTISRKDF